MIGVASVWLHVACVDHATPPNVVVHVEPSDSPSPVDEPPAEDEPRLAPARPAWTPYELRDEAAVIARASLADRSRQKDEYQAGMYAVGSSELLTAVDHFIRAHRAWPSPAAKWRIADCYDKLGRVDDAVVAYRWFVASRPPAVYADEVARAHERIELLSSDQRTAVQRARAFFQAGVAAFDAGDYELAKHEFLKAYASSPRHEVLINVALCDVRLGNAAVACGVYQAYLKQGGARRHASLDGLCGP